MDFDSKVHDLLSQWEHQDGKLTPEALCAQCPELLDQVKDGIARLQRVGGVMAGASAGNPASVPPKLSVQGYEIIRELGQGGQGVVYLARRTSIDRQCAIKVLRNGLWATDAQLSRFEREARILSALKHPGIVTAFDFGKSDDGALYLVMDFIDGLTLEEYAKSRKVHETREGLREGIEVFIRVCSAMGAAHVKGIIHRDLKPSNIRVDGHGQPHILDFGLARTAFDAMASASEAALTMSGQFLGTLPWSSPEQATGDWGSIDTRTDVYSLGVILYQLVTGGHFPYAVTGSLFDVVKNIRSTEPTPPSQVLRKQAAHKRRLSLSLSGSAIRIDADLEAIILMALAKSRERRYHSASELAQDLRRYLNHERPVAAVYVRRKRGVTVVLAGAAMLSTFVAAAFFFSREKGPAIDGQLHPPTLSTRPAINPIVDPRIASRVELLTRLKTFGDNLEELKLIDAALDAQWRTEIKQLRESILKDLSSPPESSLEWNPENKTRINQLVLHETSLVDGQLEVLRRRAQDAVESWIQTQQARSEISGPLSDRTAAALDKVWMEKRDKTLSELSRPPTISDAASAKNDLDQLENEIQSIHKLLPPEPPQEATSGAEKWDADITSRIHRLWEECMTGSCGQLRTGSSEAPKFAMAQTEKYAHAKVELESARQALREFTVLIPQSRDKDAMDDNAWARLRSAVGIAQGFNTLPETQGLSDPTIQVAALLLQAHDSPDVKQLLQFPMEDPAATLEVLLERFRRIEKVAAGRWPTNVADIETVLPLYERCGKSSAELHLAAALAKPLQTEMDLLLTAQLVRCGQLAPLAELAAFALKNAPALPLQDNKSLDWLRYDMALYKQRLAPVSNEQAARTSTDDLIKISGALGNDLPHRINSMLKVRLPRLSQNGDPWAPYPMDPKRREFQLKLEGVDEPLDFVLVQGKGADAPPDFYIMTTELSLEEFLHLTSSEQNWADVAKLMPAPTQGRPWTWTWNERGQFAIAPAGIPNDLKVYIGTSHDDMVKYPMTYIPPAAALYVAASAGYRLPTSLEWKAVLAQATEEARKTKTGFLRPRLRGKPWTDQLAAGKQGGYWLDDGIFLPPALAIPIHEQAGAWDPTALKNQFGVFMNGTPDGDGSVIYRKLLYNADGELKDVLGNVAEFVVDYDTGPVIEPAYDKVRDWVTANAERVYVVGGSALSPPELEPTHPYPVTKNGAVGYSDVGFRLAFDADDARVAYLTRYEWMLKRLPYMPPPQTPAAAPQEDNNK